MQTKLLQKLEKTMRLLNSQLDDYEVKLEFHVPDFKSLASGEEEDMNPHIIATYSGLRGNTGEKRISLGSTAMHSTPEEICRHVKELICELKHDTDDIVMG